MVLVDPVSRCIQMYPDVSRMLLNSATAQGLWRLSAESAHLDNGHCLKRLLVEDVSWERLQVVGVEPGFYKGEVVQRRREKVRYRVGWVGDQGAQVSVWEDAPAQLDERTMCQHERLSDHGQVFQL